MSLSQLKPVPRSVAEDASAAPPRPGEVSTQQAQLLQMLHLLSEKLGRVPLKSLVSETVGVVERHYIEAALAATSGNRSAAAKILGLSRQSLYMKLARYGIGTD